MPKNLVIKLKRWSVEEIDALIGKNSNQNSCETKDIKTKNKIVPQMSKKEAKTIQHDEAKNSEKSKTGEKKKKMTNSTFEMLTKTNKKNKKNQNDDKSTNKYAAND